MAGTLNYDPQVLNLVLYAGDGAKFTLSVTTEGDPTNLSGTMLAQIRLKRDSADPPDATFAIDLAGAVEGIAVLSLTGDQTQDLGKFTGVWDLEWTPTGKEPRTLMQGKVDCLLDVSH